MATYSFINKPKNGQQIVRGDQPNRFATKQTETTVNQIDSFEAYSKNLRSYPYTITETSSTVTTIAYTTPSGIINKTITEVSSTVTTIVFSGASYPLSITTKTITDGSPITTTYS